MLRAIRAAKRSCEADLLAQKNVVGVGVGFRQRQGKLTDERCIVVSVVEKLPAHHVAKGGLVPYSVQGFRTDVQETGVIRALRTSKHRPAPGGVSIGHHLVTAGTLGCLVQKGGEAFILSNNHVLANSNLGKVGDSIIQPGTYDGGTEAEDTIATLWEWVEVKFLLDQLPECPTAIGVAKVMNWMAKRSGSKHRVRAYQEPGLPTNLVDAAIAKPVYPDQVSREILEIGVPSGTMVGELGMPVRKSGRTTGLTRGKITQVDLTIQVQYGGPTDIALFTDQFQADMQCGGGDSGSAVLSEDNNVVGLLFAGPQDGSFAICNRFEHVQDLLGVTIA